MNLYLQISPNIQHDKWEDTVNVQIKFLSSTVEREMLCLRRACIFKMIHCAERDLTEDQHIVSVISGNGAIH
jgi:hypothetical protein